MRVPLQRRRVRGWVLEADAAPATERHRLVPVRAVVSAGPPPDVVALCEWAAWRWAGPRAAFLRAAGAPNVVDPRAEVSLEAAVFPAREAPSELTDLPDARARVIRWPPTAPRAELVRSLVAAEGSTLVVVPDPAEQDALASVLADDGREVVVVRSELPAATRTAVWDRARRGACVVVGGRLAPFAPVPDLEGVIVLDDADEALVEERAPTWNARDLAAERARRAGVPHTVVSPAPTLESVVGATEVPPPPARERAGWPRLEVVDLREQAPGAGPWTEELAAALRRALDDDGRAVCVLNRRGRARLLACPVCRELARCERCTAALREVDGSLVCPRCGHEQVAACRHCGTAGLRRLRVGVVGARDHVGALVPRAQVVAVDASSAPLPTWDIAVGTETVFHRLAAEGAVARRRPVRLVAFVDFDQELLAPRYRAAEQARWLLVRAARLVGPRGEGGIVLTQTRLPDDPTLVAVGAGDPSRADHEEVERRRALRFPPFGGLAELTGDPAALDAAVALLGPPLEVLGPHDGAALIRAPDVAALADGLAAADFSTAREHGRLRIAVDPVRI